MDAAQCKYSWTDAIQRMIERRKKEYGEQTFGNNCFFINPEFHGRKTKKIAQKNRLSCLYKTS